MPVTREALLAKLDDAYTVYFNREEVSDPIPHQAAQYAFFATNECYILSKKVNLWRAQTNEYAYVFSVPHLDESIYDACRRAALERGMARIRPHSEHKSSFITAVFVCDSATPGAMKAVQKTRHHKDFLFSFHGWMDFRAAAVDLSTGEAAVNREGKDLAEFLLGNLQKC